MLFNSFQFWIFFGIVLALYSVLGHRKQNRMLLVASYIFYGTWDWRFLSLIIISTLVDYTVGLRMVEEGRSEKARKGLITTSIAVNLGLLGVFKYFNFFIDSAAAFLDTMGLQANLPSLYVILPVGISFYTFQTMSYTIDIYRGKLQPTRDLLDFGLYVSFFPQLVAGPIERASRLLPQVLAPRATTGQDVKEGIYCILYGLFKKVVIADNMALIVNHIFALGPGEVTGAETLLGVYAFAFQIYGDFHGYSLIAQGTARLMGFHLMDNFRHPYFARNPQELWTRWHISLSSWLRDYLYIPLGGNRGGQVATYRNLMLTMLLGGLWHGAAWTFVVWGGIHGVWLAIHRFISRAFPKKEREPGLAKWIGDGIAIFVSFQIVCVTWLFFRADTIGGAWAMTLSLFQGFEVTNVVWIGVPLLIFYTLPILLYEWWVERKNDLFAMTRAPIPVRAAFYLVIIFFLLWFPAPVRSAFIYFQF